MSIFLILAFLFSVGSVLGWGLEVLFRHRFSSSNPEHRWINPGFCTGPYLPLYGSGLCALYLIASLERFAPFHSVFWNRFWLFCLMAVCMTLIEYLAGILCLKAWKVRLWDYSKLWGNIQGLICPLFSFFWAVLGAVYYFGIHPHILDALSWLSRNLAFSFFIGVFYGVFGVDFARSAQLVSKMKAFAEEEGIIVRYEELKMHVRAFRERSTRRVHFFSTFRSERSLAEHLKEAREAWEERIERLKP